MLTDVVLTVVIIVEALVVLRVIGETVLNVEELAVVVVVVVVVV